MHADRVGFGDGWDPCMNPRNPPTAVSPLPVSLRMQDNHRLTYQGIREWN